MLQISCFAWNGITWFACECHPLWPRSLSINNFNISLSFTFSVSSFTFTYSTMFIFMQFKYLDTIIYIFLILFHIYNQHNVFHLQLVQLYMHTYIFSQNNHLDLCWFRIFLQNKLHRVSQTLICKWHIHICFDTTGHYWNWPKYSFSKSTTGNKTKHNCIWKPLKGTL